MFQAPFQEPSGKDSMLPLAVPPELAELVAAIDRLPGQSTFEIWDEDSPKGSSLLLKSEFSARSGLVMLFIYGCVEAVKQAVKPPHGPSLEPWISMPDKHGSVFTLYKLYPGKQKSRDELVAMLNERLQPEDLSPAS